MFGKVTRPTPPPVEWTIERIERFRALDAADGNVEAARAAYRREKFAQWLIERGRLNEWETAL